MNRAHHPHDETGFTLIEMMVVLVILGIIMAGLTQLLVAGLNTEADQTKRAKGQLEARLALDKLRRELHCASTVSPNPNGTWPTQSVTVVLPSYCSTNTSGAVSVTWCTSGSGPYSLWRYPHATDLSAASYAAACTGTGTLWASNIVNAGIAGGQVFQGVTTPTLPSLGAPDLSFGTVAGTMGNSSTDELHGYIVDPVVSGVEQPGTEEIITIRAGSINKSILVDWSQACSLYAQSGLVDHFKVYGRTVGGEQLLTPTPGIVSSGCATTTWTDTGSVTPSGSPVSSTLAKLSLTLPIRGDTTNQRLITLQDDITLRNTPR